MQKPRIKECQHCGNEFETGPYSGHQQYCSKKCNKKAHNLRVYGVKSINPEEKRRFKLFQERGEKCEICGFEAVNKCQLDIDHINGDSKNNDFSNLQILCANCHRLKTLMNKDYRERSDKFKGEVE